ncbi:hypothetical protein ABZ671_00985 [Micromonospora sp. NPDC006766]|uniref:hypothetical protein n=1 Tax=Micromonospora sp. NPDC006766 TaxID=3154778 RepID=UPI0033EFFC73
MTTVTWDRDQDRQRWLERLTAAVTEATDSGATPDEVAAAVDAGTLAAAERAQMRAGVPVPRRPAAEADRPTFVPEPGSALAALMRRTGQLI